MRRGHRIVNKNESTSRGNDRSKGGAAAQPAATKRENKRELLRREINQGLVRRASVVVVRRWCWCDQRWCQRARTPRFEMNAIRETRVEHAFSPSVPPTTPGVSCRYINPQPPSCIASSTPLVFFCSVLRRVEEIPVRLQTRSATSMMFHRYNRGEARVQKFVDGGPLNASLENDETKLSKHFVSSSIHVSGISIDWNISEGLSVSLFRF